MITLLILTSPSMEQFYYSEIQHYRRWPAYRLMDLENKPFDVKKYEYWIYLDTYGDTIGYAIDRIKFLATSPTDSVWLHFVMQDGYNNLTIDSVVFQYGSVSYPVSYTSVQPRLTVHLGTTVSAGDEFYLTFYYHGQVGQDGFVGEGMEFQDNYIHTQGEMYGTRRWLPSYDEPYEKADTVLATIVVDTPWFAVANGRLVDVDTLGDKYAYTWLEAYSITPYLIVLAASNRWKVLEQTWNYGLITMPVYEWVDSVSSFLGTLPDILTVLSDAYGLYPFHTEKYSQVEIKQGFFSGAMENQTNTFTISSAYLDMAVHEMGHQWWGDWVTCGTYNDVWLNEGFATYTEALYREFTEGYSSYKNYINGDMGYALYYGDYPLYGTDFYDDGWYVIYVKGSSVLHMMRITFRRIYGDVALGDSMFFEALRYYGNQHAYSYATTEDFKNDLEAFTGVDWDWFFQQWIYTPGYPRFEVYWGQEGNNLTITVNQVQNYDWGYYTMDYPIRILFSDNTTMDTVLNLQGNYSETFTFSVSGTVTDIIMDPNSDYLDEVLSITGNSEELRPFRISLRGGVLNLQVPEPDGYRVELYDITGRRVFRATFDGARFSSQVNVPSGVYIYRVSSGRNTFSGKVIR